MANLVRPRGAYPVQELRRANSYVAGGAVYPGDFVTSNSSGLVVAAAASTALLGVALGYASGSGVDLLVADHPDQMFGIQSDGDHPDALTDLMLNYNIVASSPDTTFKISRMVLDHTSGATTATLPLKALSWDKSAYNNIAAANADVIVAINNHQLKGGTGTVGT